MTYACSTRLKCAAQGSGAHFVPPPQPSRNGMLRVFKASGEEALAVQFSELVEILDEEPVTGLTLKRHLRHVCGQTRFKQRLLLADGQKLLDDTVLGEPMDLQLVVLPFEASSDEDVFRLYRAAGDSNIPVMEHFLQRPQDPDLVHGGWCLGCR